jgi:hypothetical protein
MSFLQKLFHKNFNIPYELMNLIEDINIDTYREEHRKLFCWTKYTINSMRDENGLYEKQMNILGITRMRRELKNISYLYNKKY